MVGIRLALTWMTVLPLRGPAQVDHRSAGKAITALPLAGAVVGAVVALVWLLMLWLTDSALLAAACAVTAAALFSRGMHIDALADAADGLGTYSTAERAVEVMRSGPVGPMGASAIVLTSLLQFSALSALAATHSPARTAIAIVLAYVVSRSCAAFVCCVGIPAISPSGFGGLVAQTQARGQLIFAGSIAAVSSAAAGIALASAAAEPGFAHFVSAAISAVVVGAFVVAAAAYLARYSVRRFGGISGDVIGAVLEIATTVLLLGWAVLA